MTSTAMPSQTTSGIHELVRRWHPEASHRAEMVLCHGLGEHSGRYEAVGDRLAAAGIGVTAYDQIGFGASGGRRAWVDDWTDVLDQIQRHVVEARASGLPVVLLGHSGGGLFALEYALAERPGPDLLVLSAPALGGGAAWQRALAPIIGAILPRLEIPNVFRADALSRDPAVGDAYLSDPLVVLKTTAGFGRQMLAAIDRTKAAVASLSIPTLVIHGASDSIVPPQSSALLGELDAVDRRIYPGLRHELFNEPEGMDVVDDVIRWIDSRLG